MLLFFFGQLLFRTFGLPTQNSFRLILCSDSQDTFTRVQDTAGAEPFGHRVTPKLFILLAMLDVNLMPLM